MAGGTRGPSEGLHKGPTVGRGGRGKSATPQPTAGLRGRDCTCRAHSAVRGRRQGTREPPPLPPPPSPSGPRADEGRPKKRRPCTPPEAAAPGLRGHHGRGRCPHALPAAGRWRTGGTQVGAYGAAPSEAGPGKTGARTRAGAPPPPPALTHWQQTGPRPTPAAARQPPRHEYTPGGHAGDNGWQADARRGGEAGGRPPHPPPPPAPPHQLGGHRSDPPPPRSRGDAPPPAEGTATQGGAMRLDLHTARPSAPSRLLPRGSRPTGEPTPARRSNARTKPGGGARRRTRTVWRPRPLLPSHDHSPLREDRGGVQVCRGPRGSGPWATPNPPPPRGGPAPLTARARRRGVRQRHEGGQDGEPRAATQRASREAAARPPPPGPPHRPAGRGGPGPHPPRQGGWSPLLPPERGAGARPAPPP